MRALKSRKTMQAALGTLGVFAGVLVFASAPAFAVAPEIVLGSENAVAVTPYDAQLEAKVNPESLVTTYRFEYSESNTLAGAASIGEAAIPAGTEPQSVGPVDLGEGLTPGTVYYYRVIASNTTGTTESPIESFTTKTLEQPFIDEESVYAVTQTTAQFAGLINGEYQGTLCAWQYVNDAAFTEHGYTGAAEILCGPEEIGGAAFEPVGSQAPPVLAPNTVYHYRVHAKNAVGETFGPDETFSTLPYAPVALTGQASAVTSTSARIAGSVNPGSVGPDSATTYWFQYGTTDAYGAQLPLAPGNAGEGQGTIPEEAILAGLAPGTTYHYRIVASNDNNAIPQPDYGEDATFTTTATPPVLAGVSVQNVTQTAATIAATLETQGLPTRYELQLGNTPSQLQPQAAGDTSATTPLALSAGSLTPGTTYYYKLTATSQDEDVPVESQGTFTTPPGPAASTPPAPPALIPYTTIAEINATEAREEKAGSKTTTRSLTRAQKLAKALKLCAKKPKQKHAGCQAQARKRYGPAKRRKG